MSSRENGFTLIELAISLMVIGILIGGLLKGQELLRNAELNRALQDIKAVEAAQGTFEATYDSLPGDIRDPQDKVPDCGTSPCNVSGNNNRSYDNSYEAGNYYLQLTKAGMLTSASMGFSTYAALAHMTNLIFYKNYWMAVNWVGSPYTGNLVANMYRFGPLTGGAFPKTLPEYLDLKIDDGKPRTGLVVAPPSCVTAAAVDYSGWTNAANCTFHMEMPAVIATFKPVSF